MHSRSGAIVPSVPRLSPPSHLDGPAPLARARTGFHLALVARLARRKVGNPPGVARTLRARQRARADGVDRSVRAPHQPPRAPHAPTPACSSTNCVCKRAHSARRHARAHVVRACYNVCGPVCSRSCCLDPARIATVLRLLPVFCAACDKLVALRGPTYLQRLWCVNAHAARWLSCRPPMRAQASLDPEPSSDVPDPSGV
jgi:hypothetical protein